MCRALARRRLDCHVVTVQSGTVSFSKLSNSTVPKQREILARSRVQVATDAQFHGPIWRSQLSTSRCMYEPFNSLPSKETVSNRVSWVISVGMWPDSPEDAVRHAARFRHVRQTSYTHQQVCCCATEVRRVKTICRFRSGWVLICMSLARIPHVLQLGDFCTINAPAN